MTPNEPESPTPEDTPESAPKADTAEDPARRNDSARIGILFMVFILGLYLLRWWEPVDLWVIEPMTMFIATLARVTLGLTGAVVSQDGTIVGYGGIHLNILEECNGVPAMIVFLAAILAYPAPISRKILGIVIGIPAIFALNQVRVTSLFLVYKHMSPRLFDLMHIYVWQFVVITFAVLLWLYWAERFVRRHRPEGTAS